MPASAATTALISLLPLAASAALLYAALHDIAARTIPNQVPAGLALLGLAQRLITHSILPGLICAGLIFALAAFCWRRGWLGGGDVKLLAACVLVLPPLLCPGFIGAVALAGGVLALIYGTLALLARRRALPLRRWQTERGQSGRGLLRRALIAERWRLSRGAPLPYATAIAAGFLFTLLRS